MPDPITTYFVAYFVWRMYKAACNLAGVHNSPVEDDAYDALVSAGFEAGFYDNEASQELRERMHNYREYDDAIRTVRCHRGRATQHAG